jgi:hypothetical protein
MYPFFVPLGPGLGAARAAADIAELTARVNQLELAFGLALETLQQFADKMGAIQGGKSLREELKHLIPENESVVREEIATIDEFLKADHRPKAARLIRDSTGLPWDQIHEMLRRWNHSPLDQRLRWLQIARWVNAVKKKLNASQTQIEK